MTSESSRRRRLGAAVYRIRPRPDGRLGRLDSDVAAVYGGATVLREGIRPWPGATMAP